ncbi:hypothetical protein JTE90_026438 [Oedothorax gibbosus]|uniref:small monomeric GTPase n=1 Tax=Oedothorax gibbosus TaxID=931172 RepID=A0AAV6VPW2_9ARAC|nr:hypothetical protein JTE90_026438 [Oedothorax gibbosus]
MTSAMRSIRRKKSSLSEVKIAVIGAPGVGKSALTVRFLTKRYIGEYDHHAENKYKNEVLVDNEPVLFEIIDTCPKLQPDSEFPKDEILLWADGFLMVYSIIDASSFTYLVEAKKLIKTLRPPSPGGMHPSCPILVVGNKADLIHLRQVAAEDGEKLAKEHEASFIEVAASEHVTQVADAFCELCREVQVYRRRSKQSLLDRIKYGTKNSKSDAKK